MEVARRLVWRCLVDDPVLFFRTILEQLTKKDKQVSLESSLCLVGGVVTLLYRNVFRNIYSITDLHAATTVIICCSSKLELAIPADFVCC